MPDIKDDMDQLSIQDCLNTHCPWSGDPVSADSLTLYQGKVVGFCNPGCRDKFEKAVTQFETAICSGDEDNSLGNDEMGQG